MRKPLAILGSTGSIGTQTLDGAASDRFAVTRWWRTARWKALYRCGSSIPQIVAALSVEPAGGSPADRGNASGWAEENVLRGAARACDADDADGGGRGRVVGLAAVMEALACGKRVLLANKEPLVAGGELVTEAARAGHPLLPVDSEHSAIFRCLQGAWWGNHTPTRLDSDGERRAVPHVEERGHLQRGGLSRRSSTRTEHGPQDHTLIPRR